MSINGLLNRISAPVRFALLLSLLLAFMQTGWGQNTNAGEIRGTVTDSSGAVVPGVSVVIINNDTGVKRELVSNEAGIYNAVSVLPGNYTILFNKEGFSKLRKDGIELRFGVITVDAQLNVGATSEQVRVVADVAMLQTETSEHAATLRSEVMSQLPNVGQDWVGYLRVLPGVTGSGTGVSINGTQRYQGGWLADGGNVTIPHSQNVQTGVFESVAEVKVSTASFDAQYGNGTAMINRLSKSGTNEFHGAAYEYAQNDFFNARSFFAKRVSNMRRHQYGGAFGGPIKRDKLFFYFNYDRTFQHSASTSFYTYPTEAMRAGDFSNPVFRPIYDPGTLANVDGKWVRQPFAGNKIPTTKLDPVAQNIQKYFPMPDQPGFYNNYYYQAVGTSPATNYFGRFDYNPSDTNRITGSVRFQARAGFTPRPTCPMDCYTGYIDDWQTQLTDVWTASPSIVNEFRIAFLRQANSYLSPNIGQGYPEKIGLKFGIADIFPDVSIGGPVGGTSIGGGLKALLMVNSFAPSDVVTMIRGRHILKFGGELQIHQDNMDTWGSEKSAVMSFSGAFTTRAPFDAASGLGYADFLTGKAAGWSAFINPMTGVRSKAQQMFVQDDIKLRPNLTLNLGIRYHIQTGWSEVGNRIALFDPNLTNPVTNTPGAMWWAGNNGRTSIQKRRANIFLPRLGFAWTPASKWSVRGGFGVFTHMWGTDNYANSGRGLGYSSSGSMSSTDGMTPVLTLSDANPKLNLFVPGPNNRQPGSLNGQAVSYYPHETPVPRIYEWSFTIGRELRRGMVAEVAYVGNTAGNLSNPRDINQVPEDRLAAGNAQPRRPYPQFQGISADLYDGTSNYHAFQASLRKAFASGLAFETNYTWSKNLADQDASGWNGQAGSTNWQRAYAPKSNYGLSNNHIPHMLKGNAVYEWPFGKGRKWLDHGGLVDAILGGWQTSVLFFAHSGAPFTPVMGSQNLSNSLAGSWYPIRIGSGTLDNPTLAKWFDTGAFMRPPEFTFGNSGRNILRGPMMSNIDLSMAKAFALPILGEAGKLQIRFDATNAINHPSFSNPNASIGTSGAGIVSGTTIGGRTVQLGARLAF